MIIVRFLVIICLATIILPIAHCWQQWDFLSFPNDEWRELWARDGLGDRRGHTMVLYNESKVILFGGRGNDAHLPHVPRRFDIVEEGGVLEFATHDNHPLSANYSPNSNECQPIKTCIPLTNSSSGNEEVCSHSWEHLLQNITSSIDLTKIEEVCGFVPAGILYNDVWKYDTDCFRYADLACADDGWRSLHPGKTFGGCNKKNGKLVCETPSERYGHGSAMLNETTMAVYGGYSNECEDYCDDMWLFDFLSLQWTKVESPTTPGNRWQFSMVGDGSSIYLFGGHRLWHGFSSDNDASNRWQNAEELPKGGYLNDLWMFSGTIDQSASSHQKSMRPDDYHSTLLSGTPDTNIAPEKQWINIKGKTTCVDAPGLTWERRNDQHCEIIWPSARSGHSSVYDERRGGMWLHGGFSAYYPYPTSKDSGSSLGTRSLGREHVALYPTWEFYLDDLWFYDFKSGYWSKKTIFGTRKPQRRTGHVLSVSGDMLILHGGFGDNIHFEDTWYYIIEENRWLEKTEFVHASYPDSTTCTDDLEAISNDPTCIELEFPPDLKRSNESTLALDYQELLPYSQQNGYTPDPEYPFYFGIVDDAEIFLQELRHKYLDNEVYDEKGHRIWLESSVPDGTPIAPKAATAPRQYARKKVVEYNQTTELEIWEWCVSVKGEPTRDRGRDRGRAQGRAQSPIIGRSNTSVFIPQPRRQSPGWDGCRDIEWKHPPARAEHASVYVEKYNMLVTHGGISYTPNNRSLNQARVISDMYVLNMHSCTHNCSGNGVCTNGFCRCDPGYYGIDCSNVTCPGTVCEYDGDHNQHCAHCCYDSIDERKVPCRLDDDELMLFTGESEGICDGFGTCQCAPPYIGEDCSILDCKNNCSFNGYCFVEFPQSRCMCKDGYTGEYCQNFDCLNNCSYPNGICNQETGVCDCNTLYSPYDRTQTWNKWQGLDCSYLPAFSASYHVCVGISTLVAVCMLLWWSYTIHM